MSYIFAKSVVADDDLAETLRPRTLLKAFLFFYIPYLLGFLSGSPASLRLWIAVQKAPSVPLSSDGFIHGRRAPNWHLIFAGLILMTLSIVEITLILGNHMGQIVAEIGLIFVCIGLFFMTVRFVPQICGLDSMVVYRKPSGGYIRWQHVSDLSSWIRILYIFCSLLVVIGLFGRGGIFSVPVITLMVVYTFSGSFFGKLSLRKMIGFYMLFLFLVSFTWFTCNRNLYHIYLPNGWDRMVFLPAALCSALPGGLIARMLRLDYQTYLDKSEHAEELNPVIVPPPEEGNIFIRKKILVEGVLVPQQAPQSFLKSYYVLALITWNLVHILTIFLHLFFKFPVTDSYTACAVAVILEFPIMVVVLLSFAAVRGETKALWNYGETWIVNPSEGSISLPPDNI